jgi:hypothetical protein
MDRFVLLEENLASFKNFDGAVVDDLLDDWAIEVLQEFFETRNVVQKVGDVVLIENI